MLSNSLNSVASKHTKILLCGYKYSRCEASTIWHGQILTPATSSGTYFCFIPSISYANWASEKTRQIQDVTTTKWNNFYQKYEEFVRLTDVQNAQLEVRQAEAKFFAARNDERAVMRDVLEIRDQLKHVRERLSHVNYSSPLYPQLANEQHELVTKEEKMKSVMSSVEEKERNTFLELSAAMRDSYEKERSRVERTKNWSLIGSVIGTVIGMLGSAYINRMRTEELQTMIAERNQNDDIKEKIAEVVPQIESQYSSIKDDITQLQVCLVNKLLGPVSSQRDFQTNQFEEVSSDQIYSILNSFKQVLQSFQDQLLTLLQNASLNHELLSEQNEQLTELITVFNRTVQSGTSTPHVSAENYKQLPQHMLNSNRVQPIRPQQTESSSGEKPATDNKQPVDQTPEDKRTKEEATGHPTIHIFVWGALMTAIYYIMCPS